MDKYYFKRLKENKFIQKKGTIQYKMLSSSHEVS